MTNPEQRLIVTDLDGTLLHDAPTFEERFITQRSIDTVKRMHDAGYRFAVATALPVAPASSTRVSCRSTRTFISTVP